MIVTFNRQNTIMLNVEAIKKIILENNKAFEAKEDYKFPRTLFKVKNMPKDIPGYDLYWEKLSN